MAIEWTAAAFAALGLRAGQALALFVENGPRWLQADQGILQVCRRVIALYYLDAQDGRARQIACRIQ